MTPPSSDWLRKTSLRFPFQNWVAVAILVYVWFAVIRHLRVEWTLNEQYAYGWCIPFLCAFLVWKRWPEATVGSMMVTGSRQFTRSLLFPAAFLLLIAAFLLTRLIEEANPDWRLVSWLLTTEAIAFSLLFLYLWKGAAVVRRLAFPIIFFLVSVPWPTFLEQGIIQTLTRANTSITVDVLNWCGFPALQHGNVIETAAGLVDIDTACSGVRSLQASFMMALFFGGLKRLSALRWVALGGITVALALFCNAARTVFLSILTANSGPAATDRWHDPAGLIVLVVCFTAVWAAASWVGGKSQVQDYRAVTDGPAHTPGPAFNLQFSRSLAILILFLLVMGESAVQLWYRSSSPPAALEWEVHLPHENPHFKSVAIPSETTRILRFTEGQSAQWPNSDGTHWQFFYFRWAPGRTAINLARNHTPDICLPAAGHKLANLPDTRSVDLGATMLNFRSFAAGTSARPLYVFYSLWEDGSESQVSSSQTLTVESRLNAIKSRRRNPGQRVLEIAIANAKDFAEAEASLRRHLPSVVKIHPEVARASLR